MDVSSRLMTVLTLMIKSEYSLLIIKVRTTASPYMRTVRRSFLTFLCSGLMQSMASQEHLTWPCITVTASILLILIVMEY